MQYHPFCSHLLVPFHQTLLFSTHRRVHQLIDYARLLALQEFIELRERHGLPTFVVQLQASVVCMLKFVDDSPLHFGEDDPESQSQSASSQITVVLSMQEVRKVCESDGPSLLSHFLTRDGRLPLPQTPRFVGVQIQAPKHLFDGVLHDLYRVPLHLPPVHSVPHQVFVLLVLLQVLLYYVKSFNAVSVLFGSSVKHHFRSIDEGFLKR